MSGEIITTSGRDATTIAIEIRTIHTNAMTSLMVAAVEIGRRLVEAKGLVAHGDWGDYIANQVGYSHSQCNNYMRLYQEYGDKLNSQSIGNLEPSKALALLALPADERVSFAEAHEGESVRQFKAEIAKLKGRAEEAAGQVAATQQLLQIATEENGALRQRLDGIDADYNAQLATVDRENEQLRTDLEAARENNGLLAQRAGKAEAEAASLRADLLAAQGKGAEISPEQADALRQEGAEAAMSAQRELLAAAEAKAADIQASKDQEIAELRAMLKKAQKTAPAAAANPNYGAFKAAFEALVPAFQQVCKYAVAAADTEEQVTMNRNAIKGLLLKLGQMADREVTVV